MQTEAERSGFCYYRAAGRSLNAVTLHRHAIQQAIENVRGFVLLCGAERALGGARISGLHFAGHLPPGWVRNASAPHMAIPDTDTTRGMSFARKMAELRIPDAAEFGMLINAEAQASSLNPSSPLITVIWPFYERIKDGWVIKCPIDEKGKHALPPDAIPLSENEYRQLAIAPSFNIIAIDSDDMTDH